MQKIWTVICLVALLSFVTACGSSGDQPRDPKNPKNPRLAEVPKPDGRWDVVAKSCDTKPLAVKPLDSCKFDPSIFVHIERHSDSATQRCHIAYLYMQILQSFTSGDDSYEETAVLRPAKTKKVCWAKVNGRVQSEPLSTEILDWGAPTRSLSLVVDRNSLGLSLQGTEECSGTLRLTLRRR